MKQSVTITNPTIARLLANDPSFTNAKLNEVEATPEHKFKVGETRKLVGLVDFPEFNGQEVTIDGIRANGSRGRAYYIKGAIDKFLNWVYEYRLE